MKLPEGIGFTADDFNIDPYYASQIAHECNAKLPALFEEWIKREGALMYVWHAYYEGWRGDQKKLNEATHQAYLMLATEIKK